MVTNATGTTSKTIIYTGDGFYTVKPVPLCESCKEPMRPLAWLCARCGGVDG